jgi:hypothetical protein
VIVLLAKPVVALQRDTLLADTLPTGAVVEFPNDPGSFFLEVYWKGRCYSVFRDDLRDGCTWEDAERIGLG